MTSKRVGLFLIFLSSLALALQQTLKLKLKLFLHLLDRLLFVNLYRSLTLNVFPLVAFIFLYSYLHI